jgi:arylsulfatase A-like enzyme
MRSYQAIRLQPPNRGPAHDEVAFGEKAASLRPENSERVHARNDDRDLVVAPCVHAKASALRRGFSTSRSRRHFFLDRHKAGPFFLFFTPTLPHANNERGKKEGNGMEVPSDAPYSGEPWPQPQKNHAAMITRLDGDVGKVLARLRELGLEENTIVFFTSDNGPHKEGGADPAFFKSSGALRGFKRAMYEGGIRVPMIVRWPGKVPAGTVSDAVWAFWDVLPTLAALAGGSTSVKLDGIDVTTALVGNPRRATISCTGSFTKVASGRPFESMIGRPSGSPRTSRLSFTTSRSIKVKRTISRRINPAS